MELRAHLGTGRRLAVPRSLAAGYGAVASLLVIVYFLPVTSDNVQVAIYEMLGIGVPVSIVIGLLRYRPANKVHWLLFLAGFTSWAVGDAYWNYYRWILHAQAGYPSLADVAYQFGYPMLIVGAFALTAGRRKPSLRELLDAAIVAVGAATLAWTVLVEPALMQSGLSAAGTAFTISTPVADVVLLLAVAELAFRTRITNVALRCVIASFGFTLLADVAYSYLNLHGGYTNGMFIDGGWMLGYALLAVAALHPSMATIRPVVQAKISRPTGWRLAILGAALFAAPLALLADFL
ncbi:MAG: hypothetical protein QOG06_826, partial [Gaiellaceae bacterium]|nr:hypothetical protein [Gaiellaceae bacterium]